MAFQPLLRLHQYCNTLKENVSGQLKAFQAREPLILSLVWEAIYKKNGNLGSSSLLILRNRPKLGLANLSEVYFLCHGQ